MFRTVLLQLLVAAVLLRDAAGKKDMAAYCGGETARIITPNWCLSVAPPAAACKAVVDELQYSIKSEDPTKTLQVSVAALVGGISSCSCGRYR